VKNKICLITGSTSGIGKATAASLAAKGAIVIITGRNEEKGEQIVTEIKNRMTNHNIFFEFGDLANLKSVVDLAYRLNKNYPKLDVLINNAGSFTEKRQYTNDGIEMQFGVNHIAHFLLTHLLMPALKKSDAARIINVSSNAHYRGNINFEDLYGEQKYVPFKIYAQSKLANVLFTYELARRLSEDNLNHITANALHPGEVKTQFVEKNGNTLYKVGWKMAKPFMQSIEQGAATTVYLATAKQMEGKTAEYWSKMKKTKSSKISYDEQVADRLWNVSRALCGSYMN